MTEKEINELIGINLNVLGSRNDKRESYYYFLDSKGKRIDYLDIEPKLIAQYMEKYDLVTINGEFCSLTKNGIKIYENKGWLEHLKEKEDKEKINAIKETQKDIQETIIRKETISEFEYKKYAFYILIVGTLIALLSWLTQGS